MDNYITIEELISELPHATIVQGNQFITITTRLDEYQKSAQTLRKQFMFNYLVNITGVDQLPALEVITHLRDLSTGQMVALRTATEDRDKPVIDTLSHLWPSAIYMEREIYDLLGIRFNGNPDMNRLFMEDDYQGFPLRKDFIDPINPPKER